MATKRSTCFLISMSNKLINIHMRTIFIIFWIRIDWCFSLETCFLYFTFEHKHLHLYHSISVKKHSRRTANLVSHLFMSQMDYFASCVASLHVPNGLLCLFCRISSYPKWITLPLVSYLFMSQMDYFAFSVVYLHVPNGLLDIVKHWPLLEFINSCEHRIRLTIFGN